MRTDTSGRAARDQRNHLVIGRCIGWYRTEAADLTVEDRACIWRSVATWLDDHYQTTLDQATEEQLAEWRSAQTCSPRTLAKKISGLHVFYTWLLEIDQSRTDDPSRRLRRPRRVKRDSDLVTKVITDEEFFAAVEAAVPDAELVALLLLGRYCGLRRVEMARLRVCDVQPREGGGAWLAVLGKGSVWRRVPCPPLVHRVLRPFLHGRGYLFTHRLGRPYRPREIGDKVNGHLRALGIGHVMHDTRHTYATVALELGANIRQVQELLGHASLETTALYTHVQPTELAEVVDLVTSRSLEHAPPSALRSTS